eukprot:6700838-Pyramimonas_sp.AAC.1
MRSAVRSIEESIVRSIKKSVGKSKARSLVKAVVALHRSATSSPRVVATSRARHQNRQTHTHHICHQ